MTRPRSLAFRSLEVHRPATGEKGDARARHRLTFADLLQQRRRTISATPKSSGQGVPESMASALPTDSPPDDDVAIADDDASHAVADHVGAGGHDVAVQHRPVDMPPEPPDTRPQWASKLMPTPDTLDVLLSGLGAVARSARLGADVPHPVVLALAQTIAGFCNDTAVDESEGWQVRIPLRPDVLPETTLDLSISSCWLQLRFETPLAQSRELLLLHRPSLKTLLESELNRQREIAISVD
jgi:type III secretion control protein HpaP